MNQSKILRVTPIPQPIEGDLYVDVEFSCASCDGSGTVRFTDIQWADMKKKPIRYECVECGGPNMS